MVDTGSARFQKDLNGGLIALVLLSVIAAAEQDLYGYEIAKRLRRADEGPAIFKPNTLYPVLRALHAKGLLSSRIVPSYGGPARRYYRITPEGQSVLADWRRIWQTTRAFVDRFADVGHPA